MLLTESNEYKELRFTVPKDKSCVLKRFFDLLHIFHV